jgi:short-subunit dehydrogenase
MREVALVTGASSGIGLEIAKILASQNYDLVICARRERELQDLAEEISRQHTVNCKVIVADLTTEEGVDLLIKDSGEVDILVNNAGFGILGDHLDMQLGRQLEMIELNIHALTRLSHVFGNLMVKKGKRTNNECGINCIIYFRSKFCSLLCYESLCLILL